MSVPSSSECLWLTPKANSPNTEGLPCLPAGFRPVGKDTVGRGSLVSEPRSGGAVRGGAEATGGANAGRNTGGSGGLPPTRPAAVPPQVSPETRQREGGAVRVRWAVDAVCCGALGCRCGDGLLSVTVDGKERVLCAECAADFIREESE